MNAHTHRHRCIYNGEDGFLLIQYQRPKQSGLPPGLYGYESYQNLLIHIWLKYKRICVDVMQNHKG